LKEGRTVEFNFSLCLSEIKKLAHLLKELRWAILDLRLVMVPRIMAFFFSIIIEFQELTW
jgi:hypothetical protein